MSFACQFCLVGVYFCIAQLKLQQELLALDLPPSVVYGVIAITSVEQVKKHPPPQDTHPSPLQYSPPPRNTAQPASPLLQAGPLPTIQPTSPFLQVAWVLTMFVVAALAPLIFLVIAQIRRERAVPRIRIVGSGKKPVLTLGEGMRWHLYLSYLRSHRYSLHITYY